jgi:hypothetical protein
MRQNTRELHLREEKKERTDQLYEKDNKQKAVSFGFGEFEESRFSF